MIETYSSSKSDFADLAGPGIGVAVAESSVLVSVGENKTGSPHMHAYILDSDPNAVNFSIKTIDATGTRDPFFHVYPASELATRALHHLGLSHDIQGINFSWAHPSFRPDGRSDNFTRYMQAKHDLLKTMPEDKAKILAAHATWTVQKIAIPNGYTRVADVLETGMSPDDPGEISGTVWRP